MGYARLSCFLHFRLDRCVCGGGGVLCSHRNSDQMIHVLFDLIHSHFSESELLQEVSGFGSPSPPFYSLQKNKFKSFNINILILPLKNTMPFKLLSTSLHSWCYPKGKKREHKSCMVVVREGNAESKTKM